VDKPTKIETALFDAADYLDSDATIVEYLNAAVEEGDAGFQRHCLGVW
jgi:DNA-binding phage protein